MQTNWEGRLIRLEWLWQWLRERLDKMQESIAALQQAQRNAAGVAYNWGGGSGGSTYSDAVVTTEVSAYNTDDDEYGSGAVQLVSTSDGVTPTYGDTVSVISNFSQIGTVGTRAGVIKQADGRWRLIALDCPAE